MFKNLFKENIKNIVILVVVALFLLQAIVLPIPAYSIEKDIHGRESRQVTKDITFYLHNSTSARYIFDYSTTYIFNTTLGTNTTSIWDQQRVRMNWYLHPLVAGDFSVNGVISIVVYINTKGVSAKPNLYVDIYDVSYKSAGTETSTLIYSGSDSFTVLSGIDSYQIDINDVAHTFNAGHSIRIYYEIQGGASADFGLWYGNNTYDSRITFEAYDHLNIEDIRTKDNKDVEKSNFQLNSADKTIKMQANITDPFGGYDIKLVKLTLKDPGNNIILNNISMTKNSGTPISFVNIYEVQWNYSGAEVGQYEITVWAVDNNGYYFYYHKENYNFGNYFDVNTATFFIGGLPQLGTVTVKDSGTPQQLLVGAVVKVVKGQTTIFTENTDSNGQADLNMYPGTYDIVVEWQDVVVGIEADYLVSTDFSLTINCDVFYPEFQVVDNAGAPLEGANVYVGHPNGEFLISPYITDANGIFSITQAPLGNYNLIVKWRDVEVANVNMQVNKNGHIGIIVANVFMLELTLVDSKDIGIPGAQIIIADSISRLILDSKLSDIDGYMSSQLPIGTFNITVYWQQRIIQQFDLALTGDLDQIVYCWVYYVNFLAIDPAPHNQPVESAQIVLTEPLGGGVFDSQITGSDGRLESRLPKGAVDIDVFWKGTQVHTSQVDITGDIPSSAPLQLVCDIYYLTLKAIDSRLKVIEDAQVILISSSSNEVVDSQIMDVNGEVVSRIPKGRYDITARWLDTEIYSETNKMVNQDGYYELNCWVYYLEIKVVDSRNKTLKDAQISVLMTSTNKIIAGDITNETGSIEVRLPKELYNIEVIWEGVLVKSELNYSLQNDDILRLACNVFYITVKAIDIESVPLENAQITLSFSTTHKVYDSQLTSTDGTIESRIPIGEYDIEVYWKGVLVYQEASYNINFDTTYTVNANVFYLTIKAIGNDDEPIKDVSITIEAEMAEIIENQYTNKAGTTEFRLPLESYDIKARLQTTYLLKDIDLQETGSVELSNNSATITLKFKDYPPPITDTPLFWIVLGVIIFIIFILLLWFFVIRKLKKRMKEDIVEDERLPIGAEPPKIAEPIAKPIDSELVTPAKVKVAEPVKSLDEKHLDE